VDKLDHAKSLSTSQRQHFIASKIRETMLLILNEYIAKKNELRRSSSDNVQNTGPIELALLVPTRSASVDLA